MDHPARSPFVNEGVAWIGWLVLFFLEKRLVVPKIASGT
jgi:hypothetical protein